MSVTSQYLADLISPDMARGHCPSDGPEGDPAMQECSVPTSFSWRRGGSDLGDPDGTGNSVIHWECGNRRIIKSLRFRSNVVSALD